MDSNNQMLFIIFIIAITVVIILIKRKNKQVNDGNIDDRIIDWSGDYGSISLVKKNQHEHIELKDDFREGTGDVRTKNDQEHQ